MSRCRATQARIHDGVMWKRIVLALKKSNLCFNIKYFIFFRVDPYPSLIMRVSSLSFHECMYHYVFKKMEEKTQKFELGQV